MAESTESTVKLQCLLGLNFDEVGRQGEGGRLRPDKRAILGVPKVDAQRVVRIVVLEKQYW